MTPGPPGEPNKTLPMFPLGTVLFPGAALPLHVFEPRYRRMTQDCLEGEREFGVVLIERGSEVGGGDVRTDVGTVARIVAAQPLPDGRTFLLTVGTRRIRVVRWLDDDPYPRAEVEDWDDRDDELDGAEYRQLLVSARRVLALAAELGVAAGDATTDFADDPATGTFQVAALAPLGPLDRQRVLVADSPGERCRVLSGLLADEAEVLTFRLGTGGPGDGPGDGPGGEEPGPGDADRA
jgi:Lon protease-like protein